MDGSPVIGASLRPEGNKRRQFPARNAIPGQPVLRRQYIETRTELGKNRTNVGLRAKRLRLDRRRAKPLVARRRRATLLTNCNHYLRRCAEQGNRNVTFLT